MGVARKGQLYSALYTFPHKIDVGNVVSRAYLKSFPPLLGEFQDFLKLFRPGKADIWKTGSKVTYHINVIIEKC
nr:hypothetical protein [Thermococcus gorgonarius]